VFNVSEMEAKVREATNEDAWGASSTLMQEIAQGTFHFQHFNEIMPCIYSQFMEKEARQWRQIYKALQLLEYLIKHGSERVVDDARSHVSTLKMLRSFHYIDEKGKDQGINVRNRSKELVELLADVEQIRQERKKAKANRTKYVGTGNDGLSSGSGRYGGFGNESYASGGSYSGDYGANASGYDREYSGGGSSGFRDNTSATRKDFEEYDAGEYETSPRRTTASASNAATTTSQTRSSTTQSKAAGKAPEAPPAPVLNLLDLDDTEPVPAPGASAPASAATTTNKALPTLAPLATDDDFADFQAAPSSAPVVASSTALLAASPVAATAGKPNLMDLLTSTSPTTSRPVQSSQPQPFGTLNAALAPPLSQVRPSSTPASAPAAAYAAMPTMSVRSAVNSPVTTGTTSTTAGSSKLSGAGGFDDLWTMSLGSTAAGKPSGNSASGKSIRDLEKEKAHTGIWGSRPPVAPAPAASSSGFGSFVKPAAPSGGMSSGGPDDLLL